MANILFSILSLIPSLAEPVTGFLSQYDQGPTDGTLYYRIHESKEVMDYDYDGYLAVADCSRIGDEAILEIEYDDYDSGPLWIAILDCAGHKSTTDWFNEAGIIGEVDYYTALEHGFLDRGNVTGTLSWLEEN